MSIYAISDLHLVNSINCKALIELPHFDNDWLILAGDIGETEEHLRFALSVLTPKFKKIIWTPGNHDLWTYPLNNYTLKGEKKYLKLVSICQKYGVITPEDEYPTYSDKEIVYKVIPILTLYDYSFKPDFVKEGNEVEWASESGVICADEELLIPEPFGSIKDWCRDRCAYTEHRIASIDSEIPIIVINHYPLLKELGRIYTFPRFSIWCGTTLTEKWLDLFNIKITIYGHLHIRSSKIVRGVKHEEVSFGYPNDWDHSKGLQFYLRKIV